MGVSSSLAVPNWPLNLKRRGMNGSNRPLERTERYSMATNFAAGFSRSAVEEISRLKSEPAWMLQKRLQAWDSYEQTPFPLGRRGDLGTRRIFSNFKFQQLTPYVPADRNGELPAPIAQSLQEALVDQRSGLIVQDNASIVRTELSEALKQQG